MRGLLTFILFAVMLQLAIALPITEYTPVLIDEIFVDENWILLDYINRDNYVLFRPIGESTGRFLIKVGGKTYIRDESIELYEGSFLEMMRENSLSAGIVEAGNPDAVYITFASDPNIEIGTLKVGLSETGWNYTVSFSRKHDITEFPAFFLGEEGGFIYFADFSKIYQIPKHPEGSVVSIEKANGVPFGFLFDKYLLTYKTYRHFGTHMITITLEIDLYPLQVIEKVREKTDVYGIGEIETYSFRISRHTDEAYFSIHNQDRVFIMNVDPETEAHHFKFISTPTPSPGWTPVSPPFYDDDTRVWWRIYNIGYGHTVFFKDIDTEEIYEKQFEGGKYHVPYFFKGNPVDPTIFAVYNKEKQCIEIYRIKYYHRAPTEYVPTDPYSIINQHRWVELPIIEKVFEVEEPEYDLVYFHDPENYALVKTVPNCNGGECVYIIKFYVGGELHTAGLSEFPKFVTLLEPGNKSSAVAVTNDKIYFSLNIYGEDGWLGIISDFSFILDGLPLRYEPAELFPDSGESEWVFIAKEDENAPEKLYRIKLYHYSGAYEKSVASEKNGWLVSIDYYNGFFVLLNSEENTCTAFRFNPETWNESIVEIDEIECPHASGTTYTFGELFTYSGKGHMYSADGKARVFWIENDELKFAEVELSNEQYQSSTSTVLDPRTKMVFRAFFRYNEEDFLFVAKNLLSGVKDEETLPLFNLDGEMRHVKLMQGNGRPFKANYLHVLEGPDKEIVYRIVPLSFKPAEILSVEIASYDRLPVVGEYVPIKFQIVDEDETTFIEFFIDDQYQDTIIVPKNEGTREGGKVYFTYHYYIPEGWEAGRYTFQFIGENMVFRTVDFIEQPAGESIQLVRMTLYPKEGWGMKWEVEIEGSGEHHVLVKLIDGEEKTCYNGYVTLFGRKTLSGIETIELEEGKIYKLLVYLNGILAGSQEYIFDAEHPPPSEEPTEPAEPTEPGTREPRKLDYAETINEFFGNPLWIILLLIISAGLGISVETGLNPLTIIGGLVFLVSVFGFMNIGIGIGGLLIAVIPYVFEGGLRR